VELADALRGGRGRQLSQEIDEFGDMGLQRADGGLFLHGWLEILKGIEEILGDFDAAEEFGAFDAELGFDLGAGEFEGADPAAEADEVDGADIAQGDEFALDFPLGGGEFLFERVPGAAGGGFEQSLGVAGDAIPGAEGRTVVGDALGERLEGIDLSGAHQEKAFGDEASEGESERGAVYGDGKSGGGSEAIARQGRKILDHGKDLLDGRSGDLVEAELGPKMGIIEQLIGDGICLEWSSGPGNCEQKHKKRRGPRGKTMGESIAAKLPVCRIS